MKEKNNYYGISFFSTLGLVFIVLKLIGKIDWSWWLVLSPFLFQAVVIIICIAILAWAEGVFNKHE